MGELPVKTTLKVYIYPDEREIIKKHAREARLSVSEYLRRRALKMSL